MCRPLYKYCKKKKKKGNIFGSFARSVKVHIHDWSGDTMDLSSETMEESSSAVSDHPKLAGYGLTNY